MNFQFKLIVTILACIPLLIGCGRREQPRRVLNGTEGGVTIDGDIWADNWFALYLGDKLLIEDSDSITTERSFNAEQFTFKADYPIVLNFVVKDFKENDSGLEYIGTKRQQIGDGGFIAQFKDARTGQLLAASSSSWRCMELHHGPADDACALEKAPVAGHGPCAFTTTEETRTGNRLIFQQTDGSNRENTQSMKSAQRAVMTRSPGTGAQD